MTRFLLIVLALLVASPCSAQTALTWTKVGGPLGGLGYNVRIHPTNKNIIYVTDAWTGVNRSTDGGATWRASNTGITTRTGPSGDAIPVFSLSIDKSNPNVLWAGTQGVRGIFKSTDGGNNWAKYETGITENNGLTIRNFQIDPSNSNTVYASGELSTAIQGSEFERVQGVLYKTIDGGANWSRIWIGDSLSRWLTIDPSAPQKMLMATGIFDREAVNITGLGLLRTVDGGTTWSAVNQGLTSLFVGGLINHPSQTSTFVIATGNITENNASVYGAVHRTTDNGTTWTSVLGPHDPTSPGSQENIFAAVAYAPSDPNILYAGNAYAFYRSADGGLTWTRHVGTNGLQYGPAGVRAGVPIEITVDKDDPNTVFVNNYGGGVFKSTDGAQSWQVWSKGYTGAQIHKIAVSAQNPNLMLAIGRSGPFRSADAGNNWTGVLNGTAFLGEGGEWYSAAIHPTNAGVMLIGDEHQGGIFRSADGGASWTLAYRNPLANTTQYGRQGIQSIQFAPSNPQVVYAGFASGSFYAGPMVTAPNTSFGVYRSDNAGVTWSPKSTGLTSSNLNITALAVSATNSAVVYAGTRGGGIFKSVNSGELWTNVTANLGSNYVFAIALAANDSNIVYAGTGDQGIFKSVNGGQSWTQVLTPAASGDTGAQKIIMSIAVDPQNSSNVYAADWNSGVFRSADAGQSWLQVNTGLSTRAVDTLTLSQDGRNLYAGTKGEGIFRVDTGTGTDVSLSIRQALFVNASTSANKTSVLRIVNTTSSAGTIAVTAYDESGNQLGIAGASLGAIAANQTLTFTSAQLENLAGFAASAPTAKYSVYLSANLNNFEVINYTRDIATGNLTLSQSLTQDRSSSATASSVTRDAWFMSASTSSNKTNVLRIVDTSNQSGTLSASIYNEDGTLYGSANSSLGAIAAREMKSYTSAQLESAIGFTPVTPTSKYRAVFSANLPSMELVNFTRDIATGNLALVQAQREDRPAVSTSSSTRNVLVIYPSTNTSRNSVIRIINPNGSAAAVSAIVYDEAGSVTASGSLGTVVANQILGLTSAHLEAALGYIPLSANVKHRMVVSANVASFEVINDIKLPTSGNLYLAQAQTDNRGASSANLPPTIRNAYIIYPSASSVSTSQLVLINTTAQSGALTASAYDDSGALVASNVALGTLAANQMLTLTSAQLESLMAYMPASNAKWRIVISANLSNFELINYSSDVLTGILVLAQSQTE